MSYHHQHGYNDSGGMEQENRVSLTLGCWSSERIMTMMVVSVKSRTVSQAAMIDVSLSHCIGVTLVASLAAPM